ncbi:hypothetical protein F4775DRAFT_561483, partial [Biscogniauxia sp. FL1348]
MGRKEVAKLYIAMLLLWIWLWLWCRIMGMHVALVYIDSLPILPTSYLLPPPILPYSYILVYIPMYICYACIYVPLYIYIDRGNKKVTGYAMYYTV